MARPQSEYAAATRIGRLSVASAGWQQTKRVLRFVESDAGTLPTGTDEQGALLVHCLDISQPVAANLRAEERLFIRAFGGD